MGRYPWSTCTQAYLEAVKQYYSPSTLRTMRRGLHMIGKAFDDLKKAGRATTTNPKNLTRPDIEALLGWMRERPTRDGEGLKPATQANYIGYLQNLLRWVGNPVMDTMKSLHHVRFPQKVSGEVRVLSEDELRAILAGLENMPGWDGSVARFATTMYAYSGLRRSELRLARLKDLDTEKWTILVAHPKGEMKWASAGTATILPPAHEAVLKYLAERREYLDENKVSEAEPLIPVVYMGGRVRYWTDGVWGRVKMDAANWAGIPFRYQELRATFAQMCKDRGASIEAVSRALRHRTTRTTELYYARIRSDHAFRELQKVFSKSSSFETEPVSAK